MATDDDDFNPVEFLKSRGITPKGAAPAAPEGGAPTPGSAQAAPAGGEKSKEDKLKEMYDNDWQLRAGRGVAKGLAGAVTGAGRLATHLAPSLGEMAGKLPEGVQRKMTELGEFADSPNESWADTAGYGAGTLASLAALPGVGAAGAGARIGARFFPPMMTRAGQWVAPRGAQIARRTGQAVDAAAKGATAGAVANPDDPGTGAAIGAAGGALPGAAGAALQSRTGRYLGGHILPSGLAAMAGSAMTGVSPWLMYPAIHAIRWYSSPLGRRLHQVGSYITDQTGRIVGEIPAAAAGAGASKAMQ